MACWNLEPSGETLHGVFNRSFEPILTIDSGDSVVFKTLDAAWNLEPRDWKNLERKPVQVEGVSPEKRGDGHCLVGPVFIREAQPGTVLEIIVEEVRVGSWGWTVTASNSIAAAAGVPEGSTCYLHWELSAEEGLGVNQFGHSVKLRPFMGVMGMPMDREGNQSTIPPRRTGGNLDCKELIAGTSLFLPVEVPGGLFSVGDGHAIQGDGEVSVTAIECGMDAVRLKFVVHCDLSLDSPQARIPGATLTFGLDEDLDQAAFKASEAMVTILAERLDIDRATALALASVSVDLRVTQYVNRVKGVHAILRDDAIGSRSQD